MPAIRSRNLKIAAAGIGLLLLIGSFVLLRDNARTISGRQLDVLMQKQLIRHVVRRDPYLYVRTERMLYRIPVEGVDLKRLARRYPVTVETSSMPWLFAGALLLLLAAGGAFVLRRRRFAPTEREDSGSLQTSRTPIESAEAVRPIRSDVRFRDVAGIEEVKEDLSEIIDFLRRPGRYRSLDIRLPKGVLLVGPPGVGKTYVAKAVAGEARVPFFYQSGANIVEIYVGMGARRVHELFQAAKRTAPSIIFIDEIDAVGRHRGAAGNEEREATLNQLLTEMDGFESSSGVIVMAATNRIEMLDEALLRPGRFDRRIHISLPDRREREEILSLYLRQKPHEADLGALARATVGFSAAALATLVNEAALHAFRAGRKALTDEDFEAVRERVISGKRKILSYSDEERKIQAVYQSGKALAATWLGVPYEKIGLVTTRLKEVDREISSRSQMLNRLKVLLAGQAATRLVYAERYSNAAEDLSRARAEARALIEELGMSESIVPRADEAEALLRELDEEMTLMMKKLEGARRAIEAQLLARENIREEEARAILRDLF
ncbi:ATP-dependent metallopeptidase FtsH/Yme1/Tma family protein [Nitratifractor sp.]|uniref:ATP-dependent metallopeptidase FtsH/Yme1/Tma family protein n=1 Tax=Nitratifractor sp. TaxID=2268144 RepID=UPI0025CCDAD2|nr:ATP-dependent metallopeptidase FtsH/Yme1/Tma family protein [Nitratifractor sp.]